MHTPDRSLQRKWLLISQELERRPPCNAEEQRGCGWTVGPDITEQFLEVPSCEIFLEGPLDNFATLVVACDVHGQAFTETGGKVLHLCSFSSLPFLCGI